MTISEVSECYHISLEILREYENWGSCGELKKVKGSWQYDETDLERLSLIMTLRDSGFDEDEIKIYLGLPPKGKTTDSRRLKMLDQKRDRVLNEIHFREKQLERLDYLRHGIRSQTK